MHQYNAIFARSTLEFSRFSFGKGYLCHAKRDSRVFDKTQFIARQQLRPAAAKHTVAKIKKHRAPRGFCSLCPQRAFQYSLAQVNYESPAVYQMRVANHGGVAEFLRIRLRSGSPAAREG